MIYEGIEEMLRKGREREQVSHTEAHPSLMNQCRHEKHSKVKKMQVQIISRQLRAKVKWQVRVRVLINLQEMIRYWDLS